MSGDYITITNVFRSRGLDIDTGSFSQRMRKIIPVAIPLIDGMLARAQIIAIALELKAFNPSSKNRTFYYQHDFTPRDILFVFGGIMLIVISVIFKLIGWDGVEVFL